MKLIALSIGDNGQTTFQIVPPSGLSSVMSLPGSSSLQIIIQNAVTLLLYSTVLLAFVFVVIGGLRWITSNGDKKAIEGARNIILYAIGGLLLALLAAAIINLIGTLFGVNLLGFTF